MITAAYCLLFTLVFIWAYRQWKRGEFVQQTKEAPSAWSALLLLITTGLLIRVYVACTVYGYEIDVNTFKAWADRAASGGLAGFYATDQFVDYPPGYIYVLYAIGKLRSLLSLPYDSKHFLLLMKSPAIVSDLVISCLLYQAAARLRGIRAGAGVAMLYLLNPAVIINSAGWGQADSFFMLWLLLSFEAVRQKQLLKASVLYAIALLIKPQALLFAPLVLLLWLRRGSWRAAAFSLLAGLLTFVLLTLPFVLHQGPFWLPGLYIGTLASYPYASLNAFNLMSLLGGNFAPLSDKVGLLSYQSWSLLGIGLVLAGTVWMYTRSRKDESQLELIAAILMCGAFLVLTKMHERYLFYVLPLLLAGFVQVRDRRLLYLFCGLSLTHFTNVYRVLLDSRQKLYFVPGQDMLLLLISAAHVVLFGYLAYVGWKVIVKREIKELEERRESDAWIKAAWLSEPVRDQLSAAKESQPLAPSSNAATLPEISSRALHWQLKETLLLGLLMLAYGMLAFIGLGSAEAPETGWKAVQPGERIMIRLESVKPIERINSFSGIGDGSFSYEVSEDGQHWTPPVPVASDAFKVLMWQVVPVNASGQYIRLTVVKPTFTLNELAVYEKGSEKPVPISSVYSESADPRSQTDVLHLFDEQAKAAYRSTYFNGAYFDEIYHARTAYEHLHQLEPYESTHPPLGKILISAGISLFGMNPFGWRVIGTWFGIAMLPVMYLLGKRLFGRWEYALAASFLMACDGLHFVQTRIATIDVYAVFFILLMFYFMHQVISGSLFSPQWKKLLLPLGLSGLSFGLGAASKWIALYAGGGLALLLFLWLYGQYRQYRQAAVSLEGKHKQSRQALAEWRHRKTVFPKRAFLTLLWSAGYFVLLPAVLYVLSYIPFMRVPGPGHSLSDVLSYQLHMFTYHSQLKATHPFSSSWWEWPFMIRPVWYYGAAEAAPGTMASIVAIGNPLIWWTGFAAIVGVSYRAFRSGEKTAVFLAIVFFSQYIPWMLVPRMTFIYHYFAMLPFTMLAVVYLFKLSSDSPAGSPRGLYVYLLAAAACFALFYPVLSGLEIPRAYAEHVLKWFPGWQFF